MKYLYAAFLTLIGLTTALSQTSPYAGDERHDIKALSSKEVDDYFNGAGMGLAKAAELNNYPGPKHVIDLAEKLQLSEQQILGAKAIFITMKDEAMRLGHAIVHQERELDKMFASKAIESATLRTQTERIAKLQGELRAVHLSAHLAMRNLLSAQQVEKYDELRGYTGQGSSKRENTKHEH